MEKEEIARISTTLNSIPRVVFARVVAMQLIIIRSTRSSIKSFRDVSGVG